MNKNFLKIFIFITSLFICTGCTGGYTNYDYETRIEELENELEYKDEVIWKLENKLKDCESHYYECYTEAKYCGCTGNISTYNYYNFNN